MNFNFPKGSEWNKWDMHIHTPSSILYNGYSDDWDLYVTELFKKAISENIKAIGITDYYFIDGYKIIKNDYLLNESKLEQLFADDEIEKIKRLFVFPNIEFRINKLVIGKERDLKWNKKVNFHVLFSDELSPEDIEDNFINRLQFENEGSINESSQKVTLTKRNLSELGERLIKEQPEFDRYTPLKVGMLCASVDDNEIVNLLASQNSKFKGKFLLALPADEDLSQVNWTSQGHLSRKVLLQKSHIVFSPNPGTIEFCLGKRHESVEKYKQEFGNPKPCLWGSDAHDLDNLFKPDYERYTWIKANPTFEGLKQVVYEPEDRVKIQHNIPEEKTPYLVIDKVRFIDKTTKKTFQPNWIQLNQNFNAIIGGKSSGKSLLLYHLAKAIDKEQVDRKNELIRENDYSQFKADHPFDLEVLWKSGDKSLLSEEENSESQITFIPQLYINHLAEANGVKQLKELIESILKQNHSFKTFIEDKTAEIQKYKTNITNAIDERLIHLSDYKKLIDEKNSIGTKDKINSEINRLNKAIEKLRKESGFSENENEQFNKLSKQTNNLTIYKKEFESTLNSLKEYTNIIVEEINSFEENTERRLIDFKTNKLEDYLISKTDNRILSHLKENKEAFINEVEQLREKLETKLSNYVQRLDSIESQIKPFQEKVKNQKLLNKLEEELKQQRDKLFKIEKFEKEIDSVIEKGKKSRKDIFRNYKELFNCYKAINQELKKPIYQQIDQEITLESNLNFDCDDFSRFTELFDNRARLNNYFIRLFDDDNLFIYEEESHIQAIEKIFDGLKTGENQEIKLKSHVDIKDLFYKLLDDYFKIDYKIIYKGDDILQMSPGKRGLVLLQLILHISNASHPILIDQPEDNLDNRTIYHELKEFIKNKKSERQIITVTHNANLAVSTDSENIIVANQSGQQVGKDNKEFVFEYVTGALENTFIDYNEKGILYKYGIKEHVCDILEGGKEAFQRREIKYGFL